MSAPGRNGPPLIVFAVPDFLPWLGGTTRQTLNQAKALQRHGFDVVVLTQRIDRSWPRHDFVDGVPVERVGPTSRSGFAMKAHVLRVALWMLRRRRRITIVQVIMYPDFVVSAAIAGLADVAVMCWAGKGDATDTIGTQLRGLHTPLRALRRRALQRSAHVVLTTAIRDELAPLLPSCAIEVIPTPLDVDHYHPPSAEERAAARLRAGIAESSVAFVYTGHLRALKRVDLLLDAFGRILASGADVHLTIVGGSRADLDDRTDELRTQAARLDAGDRIHFTGTVADVREHLHAADVLVLPSDREGLSNSLLEALACGLPAVAAPSAAGDMVLDAGCGIVPPTNAAPDLAAAMTTMLDAEP